MKKAERWLAALLCLALLTAVPVPALAADGGMSAQEIAEDVLGRLAAARVTGEDVAAAFKEILDGKGIVYNDYVVTNGAHLLGIPILADNGEALDFLVFITEDGRSFDAYETSLMTMDGKTDGEALRIVNELNNRYQFVTFILDNGNLWVESHGALLGNATMAAELLWSAFRYMLVAVDSAWKDLLPESASAGEPDAQETLVGEWYFSSLITRTGQGGTVALTAELVGSDELVVLTLEENGAASLRDPGGLLRKDASVGAWTRTGDGIRLEMGETLFLTMEDDGTLLFDRDGEGGSLLVLSRREDNADAAEAGMEAASDAALSRARELLRYDDLSRAGLIEWLTKEGFSARDAALAADASGADWTEMALKSGKAYLISSPFSHQGLIGQLEYEGFTTEEATAASDILFSGVGESGRTIGEENALREVEEFLAYIPSSYRRMKSVLLSLDYSPAEAAYAVDNCRVDWAEQACLCADKYKDDYPTRDQLRRRLELDEFTDAEIACALERVGME